MSFLLIYEFIWLEALIILVNAVYLVFHFSHDWKGWKSCRSFFSTCANVFNRRKNTSTKATTKTTKKKMVHIPVKKEDKKQLSTTEKSEVKELIKKIEVHATRCEYEKMKEAIIQGLAIDKENIGLNISLANYYEFRKDFEKAEMIYKDLILILDTPSIDLYIRLAGTLLEQQKIEVAYEIYKRALSLDKDHAGVLGQMVSIAKDLNKYQDIIMYAKRLLVIQPRNKEVLQELSAAYIQTKDINDAKITLKTLLEIDPYNAWAIDSYNILSDAK